LKSLGKSWLLVVVLLPSSCEWWLVLGIPGSFCLVLLVPHSLELVGLSQVNGYSDNIGIFHRLLDFNILVRKDLHLLTAVPKTRVEHVE